MKIALVSSYVFSKEPGGVKDFILGLKTALQKRGCSVAVIAPGSKDARMQGLVDYVLGMGFKLTTDQTEFRASFARKRTAGKILEAVKPDIIVIHEPFVPSVGHAIISSLAGKKERAQRPVIVGQFHASREDLDWRLRVAEFVGTHLLRRPKLNRKTILGLSSGYVTTINNNLDARIAVSEASKKFWQKTYPAEYKVIYNGIDAKELTAGPTTPAFRGTRVILFAGRHDARKGIGDLIEAFNLLVQSGDTDLRLKITGEGEATGGLRELVKKLGLEALVQFVGVLPRPELVKAYGTADLVVAPSVDGEGFNRTIAEARSCGTLVVCTNIDGQKEAIGHELSRFMARPKNPKSLAKQIKTVLNLPESKKQEIRKLGREDAVARFGWETIAQEHINFYESLLDKQS